MSDHDEPVVDEMRHRFDTEQSAKEQERDEEVNSNSSDDSQQQQQLPIDDFHFVPYDAEHSPYAVVRFLAEHSPSLAAMLHAFGWAPLCTLVLVYFVIKGVAVTSINLATLPIFRDGLQIHDSGDYQRLAVIAALAWSFVKPLSATLSDNYPIMRYRKRWYLAGAAVVATLLLLLICVVHTPTPYLITFLLFCTNACFATIDLLCESVYSRFYLLRPGLPGTSLISLCWALVMVSGAFAAPIVGPLADQHRPFAAVLIVAGLVSLAVYPFWSNWLGEKKVPTAAATLPGTEPTEAIEADDDVELVENVETHVDEKDVVVAETSDSLKENLKKQAIAMSVLCPLTAILSMVHPESSSSISNISSPLPNCSSILRNVSTVAADISSSSSSSSSVALQRLVVPICAAALLLMCGYRFLPRKLFLVFAFMFSQEAMYISTSGALDYFFVADSACLPNGPGFSYTFYDTTTTVVSSIFGGIGAILFHKFLAHHSFRYIFVLTTILKVIASFFDIFIVMRWNSKYLGVSDKHWFVFGESMILSVVQTLNFMPAVMLTAHMCAGSEATVYAVLAGFSNFGMSLSGFVGSAMTHLFGIRTTAVTRLCNDPLKNTTTKLVVQPCDFSNLGWLLFWGHCVCPLLVLPLVKFMVPNARAKS